MTLIAAVSSQLTAQKQVVRSISRKSCFRGPFDKTHGNSVETLLESDRNHLYNIY